MAPSQPSTPGLARMLIFLPHLQKSFLSPAHSNVKGVLLLSCCTATAAAAQHLGCEGETCSGKGWSISPTLSNSQKLFTYIGECWRRAISNKLNKSLSCMVPPGLPLGWAVCAGAEGQSRDRR